MGGTPEGTTIDPESRGTQKPGNEGRGTGSTPSKKVNLEEIRLCFAPSELFGTEIAQGFGIVAEAFISFNLTPYLIKYGVAPFDLYQDYSYAGSIDKNYIGFLRLKNPNLSARVIQRLLNTPHERPDILIDNKKLKEYYEIKPDSQTGRSAGRKKMRSIADYYYKYSLPYSVGRYFNPPSELLIGRTVIYSGKTQIPVEVSFGLRLDNGLILYDLCIKTKWHLILELVHELLLKLLRAIIDLIRQAIASMRDFINKVINWIEENPWEALGMAGIAILTIIILLNPVPGDEALIPILARSVPLLSISINSKLNQPPN